MAQHETFRRVGLWLPLRGGLLAASVSPMIACGFVRNSDQPALCFESSGLTWSVAGSPDCEFSGSAVDGKGLNCEYPMKTR